MSTVQDLISRAQQIEGCLTLDEIVQDLKASEASSINNEGSKAQIHYIIEQCGEEEGIKKIKEALDE